MGKKKRILKTDESHKTINHSYIIGERFIEKRYNIIILLLLLMAAFFYFTSLNNYFSVDGDNVTYSLLAQAIVHGNGYVNLRAPFTPPFRGYWPGFPILLIIPTILFPWNIVALKFVPIICALIGLIFLYKYINLKFGKSWAIIVLFLSVINPVMYHFAHTILSQAPFFCFMIIALYYAEKFIYEKQKDFSRDFFIFTLSTIMAKYIRGEGYFLFIGIFLYILFNKRVKSAVTFLIMFVFFIGIWIVRNRLVSLRVSEVVKKYYYGLSKDNPLNMFLAADLYDLDKGMASLSEIVKRFFNNIQLLFGEFISVETLGFKFLQSSNLGVIITIFFIIYGYISTLPFKIKFTFKKMLENLSKISPIHYYFLFGLLVVVVTHAMSTKYIYPIVPFLIFFTLIGIKNFLLLMKLDLQVVKYTVTIIIIVMGLFTYGLMSSEYSFEKNFYYTDPAFAHYIKLAKWFKNNTPPGTKVLSRKGEYFYWYSRRQSIFTPTTMDADKILEFIKDLEFDYVLLTETGFDYRTRRYIDNAISKYPQFFKMIGSGYVPGTQRKFFILKVEKEKLKSFKVGA